MPQSVGASRAKMRSDSRFPISRGDYTLADLVMAADDGDWRLYWSAPWYVVGPPLDNLVVIRQTVGPPSPLRASILSSKTADFVPRPFASQQIVISGQL